MVTWKNLSTKIQIINDNILLRVRLAHNVSDMMKTQKKNKIRQVLKNTRQYNNPTYYKKKQPFAWITKDKSLNTTLITRWDHSSSDPWAPSLTPIELHIEKYESNKDDGTNMRHRERIIHVLVDWKISRIRLLKKFFPKKWKTSTLFSEINAFTVFQIIAPTSSRRNLRIHPGSVHIEEIWEPPPYLFQQSWLIRQRIHLIHPLQRFVHYNIQ